MNNKKYIRILCQHVFGREESVVELVLEKFSHSVGPHVLTPNLMGYFVLDGSLIGGLGISRG